ncbi:hypothetical protein, partial [Bradyrhizobium sp.]|uniref:hypothetical protein n=1 Tax=Bradyrhizobium sp. TaxID=376 RepID=UPI003C7689C2
MPDVSNPLTPGPVTSEGKGIKIVVIISSIVAVLGTIQSALEVVTTILPPAAKGLGMWLALGGAAIAALTQIAYTIQRSAIK